MSIFRLLIASLLFCSATFANAGVLYKGTCYSDIEKVADIFKSELSARILDNGLFLQAVQVHPIDSKTISADYLTLHPELGHTYHQTPHFINFPECTDTSLNDAVSLSWKIILVWLAAWALAQLIRIVRKESEGGSDYGHS